MGKMVNSYKKGDNDIRPWGTWEVLDCGNNFCVKKIVVTPQGCLSLQSHNYRSEHWIVISGKAIVTIDDKEICKVAGENVFIPVKTKHRIKNNGKQNLEFIEIQYGEILDENDIIRYEDIYGRN